ncbi:MAG: hypothetical protein Q4C83_00755 [Candidatus Saccharibacteria bacterium]|nr:hypothetical protein [Candidatus Saccharibacteria bacterium]
MIASVAEPNALFAAEFAVAIATLVQLGFIVITCGLAIYHFIFKRIKRLMRNKRSYRRVNELLKVDRLSRSQIVKAMTATAGELPLTNQKRMQLDAENTFTLFLHDWNKMDLASLRDYVTPEYLAYLSMVKQALIGFNRSKVTIIDDTRIDVEIEPVFGGNDDYGNVFRANIRATTADILTNTRTKREICRQQYDLQETWYFVKSNDRWRLDDIERRVDGKGLRNNGLITFAESHNGYYVGNMGNSLLPSTKQPFGKVSFTDDGYCNYVIGRLKGKHSGADNVYQIYNYVHQPLFGESRRKLVGQLNVKDSTQIGSVGASAEFKLKLRELRNVEVKLVDNTIYVIASTAAITDRNYAKILDILQSIYLEIGD